MQNGRLRAGDKNTRIFHAVAYACWLITIILSKIKGLFVQRSLAQKISLKSRSFHIVQECT